LIGKRDILLAELLSRTPEPVGTSTGKRA